MMDIENPVVELWCRKYAPRTFKRGDWLGNEDIRANLECKKQYEYINMALVGDSGLGKSLAADIIARTVFPGNWYVWNMSLEGRVKVIEKEVMDFCESGCMNGSRRKLAIFQEADGISKAAQKALRVPMEDYADKVVTIITCNYGSKVIDALHSRGCTMYFKLASILDLMMFANRIINGEGLDISDEQVSSIVRQARGKFRNAANLIQGWTTSKKVYYASQKDLNDHIATLVGHLRKEKLDKMLEEIEAMLGEYDDRTVCLGIAQHIRDSNFPQYLKTRFMVGCNDVMKALVAGSDTYTAFWSMCAEFVIMVNQYARSVKK